MSLKEQDKKNLEEFIALLETNKMRAELKGSAAQATKEDKPYGDIDLKVWDAEEKGPGYRLGKKAIDNFLHQIGIKKFKHSPFAGATWCEGRWQFKYNGTKFDILYLPDGRSASY